MKTALIYIHGFNSGSQDDQGKILLSKSKLRLLSALCRRENVQFYAPNLDYQNLEAVITYLLKLDSDLGSEGCDVNFIGTSLGGFFAEYMAMKTVTSAIMINPAFNPSMTLQRYIGPCKNYVSDQKYLWTQKNCDAFKFYEDELSHFPDGEIGRTVLLDKGDELLNSLETIQKYEGKVDLTVYEGGSHRFDHMEEALPIIKRSIHSVLFPSMND